MGVWLYNVSDAGVKRVQERLQAVCQWLGARAGLLHSFLAQKMGLFKHCQGPALASYTKVGVLLDAGGLGRAVA